MDPAEDRKEENIIMGPIGIATSEHMQEPNMNMDIACHNSDYDKKPQINIVHDMENMIKANVYTELNHQQKPKNRNAFLTMPLDCTTLDTLRNSIVTFVTSTIEGNDPPQLEIQDVFGYFPQKPAKKLASTPDVIYLLTQYKAQEKPVDLGIVWKTRDPATEPGKDIRLSRRKGKPKEPEAGIKARSHNFDRKPQLNIVHDMEMEKMIEANVYTELNHQQKPKNKNTFLTMPLDCTSLDTLSNGIVNFVMSTVEGNDPPQLEIQDVFGYFPKKPAKKLASTPDVIYLLTEYRTTEKPVNLGVVWKAHEPVTKPRRKDLRLRKGKSKKPEVEVAARVKSQSRPVDGRPPVQLDVQKQTNEKVKEELSG